MNPLLIPDIVDLTPKPRDRKVKRNGACPCGSGKRAKRCCFKYNPQDKKTKP